MDSEIEEKLINSPKASERKSYRKKEIILSYKQIVTSQYTQTEEIVWECIGNCLHMILEFEENCFPYIEEDEINGGRVIEESVNVNQPGTKKGREQWTIRFEALQLILYLDDNPEKKIIIPWENVLGSSYHKIIRKGYPIFELKMHLMKIEEASCMVEINRGESDLKFILEKENRAIFLKTLIQNFARCKDYLKIIDDQMKELKIKVFQHKMFVIIKNDKENKTKWSKVESIFKSTGYELILKHVESDEQASNHVKEINNEELVSYRCILVISGDQLLNKVINGIMQRENAKQVISRVVFNSLDGGIVSNLLSENGEPLTIQAAAYSVIKGKIRTMDLMEVQVEENKVFYSPGYILHGYFANKVNSSSKWNSFITDFWRKISQKNHPCTIYFTKQNLDNLPGLDCDLLEMNSTSQEKRSCSLQSLNSSERIEQLPFNVLNHSKSSQVIWNQVKDTSFKFINIMNISMIDKQTINAPNKTFSDGYLDLQFLSSQKSWSQLRSYASQCSSSEHFNNDMKEISPGMQFEYHKIKGFRIDGIEGGINIDGKQINCQRIQGRILPSILKVSSL